MLRVGVTLTFAKSPEQLIADLAYLDAGALWPKAAIGPVELRFTQQFRWPPRLTEAARRTSHPNVETAGGTVTLWLGQRCFVQPTLSFPFAYDDLAFVQFLNAIQPTLPFRMHANHFRAIVPGKQAGTWNVRTLPWRVPLAGRNR